MANPLLKKNPFMSLWLSAAHRIAGSLRGQAVAQTKRQVKAVIAEASAPSRPAKKARPAAATKRKH